MKASAKKFNHGCGSLPRESGDPGFVGAKNFLPLQSPFSRGRQRGLLQIMICLSLLLLPACGTFFGGSTNSTGETEITLESTATDFDASLNQELLNSFEITNHQVQALQITGAKFSDNICQAFSIYSITSPEGSTLLSEGDAISLTVAGGKSVFINIRFQPLVCKKQNYETTLDIFLKHADGSLTTQTLTLTSIGLATSPTPDDSENMDTCSEEDLASTMTNTFLSGPPPPGEYFLRIDRMRAFIYPKNEAAKEYASLIGTDIGNIDPSAFVEPHLRLVVADDMTFRLDPITQCDEFIVPSADSDQFFLGADTTMTTEAAVTGNIKAEMEILPYFDDEYTQKSTHLDLNNLTIKLRTEGIGKGSLLESPEGIFQVVLETGLSTRQTEPDEILGVIFESNAGFEEGLLRRVKIEGTPNYALEGLPLVDGKMILVGKGVFIDNDQFIGENETKEFLVGNAAEKKPPAVLYVQLEVTLMQKAEGTLP